MSNFGFRRLRLVNPFEVAFHEARSAVGAAHVLAEAQCYSTVREAVADCTLAVGTTAVRHRELQHPLRTLDAESARLIRERLQSAPVALLFGSEKVGLSNDDLSYCRWLIHIPTHEEHISMNLAQAVALCLFELSRSPSVDKIAEADGHATAGQVEVVIKVLLEVLQASGYVQPHTATSTEEKVRRLMIRLNLQSADADVLLGMLRQILWKLNSAEP